MKKYIWESKNWHKFEYDHKIIMELLSKARLAQGNLLGKVSSLDIRLETEAQAEILVEEAVRTAEIEGMKLNREAVRSSVAVKLGLPHVVGMKTERNADGLIDVLLDAIRFHNKPLTLKRLNGWQAALFPTGYSGLHKIRAGELRGNAPMRVVSGPLGREKIHFEAPPQPQMKNEVNLFLNWWNNSFRKTDGILRAAAAHLRFVTIHPYEDGNGRLARALTDMALAQDEKSNIRFYSLSSQIMKRRNDYYSILEKIQNCRTDITNWFVWFLDTFTKAVEDSQNIVANVFRKAEFWKRHIRTILNERQRKVIEKLFESYPEGFKYGLTTRKYVSIAKTSRATAFREMDDLKEKGIIRYVGGKGRSVRYEINWKV
ncbi:MAG: Fic family protein [Elusimicrobiota bacterium]|nr:Fic family protein [Elusimicrobiota bacterium]